MSGLGDALNYIGGSLDKPGRAVRGVMYGRPQEALAAIPFSDTMGITNPNDRVSGRQLTDAIGMTRTGDRGWGSSIMGHAAEMATDPLNLIPAHTIFSALHGAGHLDGLGSSASKFLASESGAAKLPTYGLGTTKGLQAQRQAYKAPVGHGIEAPADGAYRMRPGPSPKTAPMEPLPHQINPDLPEVIPQSIGEGTDYITKTASPSLGSQPQYANADDMLNSYYAKQAELGAPSNPASFDPYVVEPSQGDMRFLGDFHRAAQQGTAAGEMANLGDAIRTPSLMRRLQAIFSTEPR